MCKEKVRVKSASVDKNTQVESKENWEELKLMYINRAQYAAQLQLKN